MTDAMVRIKNRIHRAHDLNKLWERMRAEGFEVWEAEDYIDNAQAPYHLYNVQGAGQNVPVEVLYREKTEQEMAEDEALGCTPFKQHIEWVAY